MNFQLSSSNAGSKVSYFLSLVLASFLLSISLGLVVEADPSSTNIGAIIDVDSRVGKEQKTAMIMAVHNFNNNSRNRRLEIYFSNTGKDPVQVVSTAEELIGKKQVQLIVGTRTWEEAALAADVGKQAQVPVLSLAEASSTQLLTQNRWPFLVQMATDSREQINCIADIVNSYHWRKIIVIHEDNSYFANSGLLNTLSEALENVGAAIEYDMFLPPFSSLSDPEAFVRQEAAKLMSKQSRVFIVLQSSLPLATHLFREAKQIGLMDRDSVWILTDSISDLLDSVDPSFISFTQGAIGIKNYYSESTREFLDFKDQFQKNFRLEYPDEDNSDPGIHALKAYDSITAIAEAVKGLGRENTSNPKLLLNEIQSNNFIGLSGEILFRGGKLERKSTFKIVNIVGKRYKELGFWSSKFVFSGSLLEEKGTWAVGVNSMNELLSLVDWPGELNRVPKGWAMPTDAVPMKIGVPENHYPFTLLKGKSDETSNEKKFEGFCIDLFDEVLKVLNKSYTLHYEFVPFNGNYNELVGNVSNKNFDAAVGDVPVKKIQMAWIFVKPFTWNMWMVTFAILFYTMFVVWFIEHQSNPEFKGPRKDQLGTAMFFTISSLFFAHKENIISNYTKLVVVVWLFVVLVLSSSYQANLTSMLTVSRLEPSVTRLDSIKNTNAPVGSDSDSFIQGYLRDVLNLQNIKTISSQDRYPEEFKSGNISAAFLELSHQKVFLKDHCKDYTVTGPTYSFGGLGFVFQKSSPIARDVSEAILTLMECGTIEDLKKKWFGSPETCSNSDDDSEADILSLKSFRGLYIKLGRVSIINQEREDSSLYIVDFASSLWTNVDFDPLVQIVEADPSSTNIGAIIDVDSRVGKEQKTAMIMAMHNFNNNSRNQTLEIYFRNTSKDAVKAVTTAEELIGRQQVRLIIGTRTWEEVALAAYVGERAQVPILSLAAASSTELLTQNRWPFLVQMATDTREQINCTAAIVNSYHWRKIIVIHEDSSYFSNSGLLTTLSEALENVGAAIEYDLILPPFSSLSDPEGFVRQETAKLISKQSRVFIVFQLSLPLATHLFREAKQIGLMGRDSAWILTDSISDLLDSVDSSFISFMQGAIGIKNDYSESTRQFLDFKDQFRKNFRLEYPDEDNSEPGIHALKAYDSITAIAEAVKELGRDNTSNPRLLLNEIQSNNFIGLSGEIRFHGGKLEPKSTFKIVNIVGKRYKELGTWSSKIGFSGSHVDEKGSEGYWCSQYERVVQLGKLARGIGSSP
ncbi:Glutamate receptor 2.7 [Abeliophyllum distichum]|uniref:Glutamate receptor 2.7 n=1 Tax=Abeliophyllum distichum TaxID=126358 RepID=A0ABD1QGK7_9LAMI